MRITKHASFAAPQRRRSNAALLPFAPRLQALASAGWMRPLREVLPAVTCTAQATLLTGQTPEQHGIVANGWLWRDSGEVRFWQQSNRLIQATPLYVRPARRAAEAGRRFAAPNCSGGSIRERRSKSASRPNRTMAPTATRRSASPARRQD